MAITYQEVEIEITKCIAAGLTPSIPRIREALGNTGSPNTIQKHLKTWRANAPAVVRQTVKLPTQLEADIVAEIEKQSAAAKVSVEKELAEANEVADLLAVEGEKTELLLEEFQVKNKEIEDENLKLLGLCEQQKQDHEKLSGDLTKERESLEKTRIELATEKLRNEAFESTKAELKGLQADFESKKDEVSRLRNELEINGNKITLEQEKNSFLANQIEKIEAQLVSEKESHRKAVSAFDTRLSTREKELNDLNIAALDELKAKIKDLEAANAELLTENKKSLSELSDTKVLLAKAEAFKVPDEPKK
jgi:DNA repair exonuclease SbcCD ATPase subunit